MLKALPEEIISAVADEESRATARAIEGAGDAIVILETDDMMDFVIGGLDGRAAEASPASSSSASSSSAPPAAPLRKAAERRVAREAENDLTETETADGLGALLEAAKREEAGKFHKASEHPNLLNDPPAELNLPTELIQARRELKQLRTSHIQVFCWLIKLPSFARPGMFFVVQTAFFLMCQSYSRVFVR